jgi:hypothetical protein
MRIIAPNKVIVQYYRSSEHDNDDQVNNVFASLDVAMRHMQLRLHAIAADYEVSIPDELQELPTVEADKWQWLISTRDWVSEQAEYWLWHELIDLQY